MRSVLFVVTILLMAQTAHAASCGCSCKAARCADKCCGQIHIEHLALTQKPLCNPPHHKAVTPLVPCGCTSPVCLKHKPVMPLTPCECTAPVHPTCHKPVVAVIPDVDCPVTIELTGTPDLIVQPCDACGSEKAPEKDDDVKPDAAPAKK